MAVTNLNEFNNQWILFSLLFLSLITFSVTFIENNNPSAWGDDLNKFESSQSNVKAKLISIQNSSNNLLNISSENDPEVSDLGSKDSVATSYGIFGQSKEFFKSVQLFLAWVVPGEIGGILSAIFLGMVGLSGLYFITRWIRGGI